MAEKGKSKKFSLVQTRKGNAKPELFVVPTKWLKINDQTTEVKYPKTDFNRMAQDANSEPQADWIQAKCKVVGGHNTFQGAEEMIEQYADITDSEDCIEMTRGTRSTPGQTTDGQFVLGMAADGTPIIDSQENSNAQKVRIVEFNDHSEIAGYPVEVLTTDEDDPITKLTTQFETFTTNMEDWMKVLDEKQEKIMKFMVKNNIFV